MCTLPPLKTGEILSDKYMRTHKRYWSVLFLGILAGCMTVAKPTVEELAALDKPSKELQEKVDRFFPAALSWFSETEAALHPLGRTLTDRERAKATELGVRRPEDVRILVLKKFPVPSDPELKKEAQHFGLGSFFEGGRTMGHVIMLKPRLAENWPVIVHELVHVSQFDKVGREAFLRRYITEYEMLGYARAPMELEAFAKQKEAQ